MVFGTLYPSPGADFSTNSATTCMLNAPPIKNDNKSVRWAFFSENAPKWGPGSRVKFAFFPLQNRSRDAVGPDMVPGTPPEHTETPKVWSKLRFGVTFG